MTALFSENVDRSAGTEDTTLSQPAVPVWNSPNPPV
jgi:hypothetical protein